MAGTQITARPNGSTMLEQVVVGGDLAQLTPDQRMTYYGQVCSSVGLNPLTKPFEYIRLNNKLTLYARKDATDQLRSLHGVSVTVGQRERTEDGLFLVSARATMPDGRTDEEYGAVGVDGLRGEALANAMMKALTKAKRRVTLSICGLGWLDETETDSIQGSQRVVVADTGEIVGAEPPADPDKRTAYLAWIEKALKELARRKPEVDVATLGQIDHDSTLPQIEEYGRRLKEALA